MLVLEGTWDDDIVSQRSVRPLIEGWARAVEVEAVFRHFESKAGLHKWLKHFFHPNTKATVCYIAADGDGRRLSGLKSSINVQSILKEITRSHAQKGENKGILLGACEAGKEVARKEILKSTGPSLKWVAGYEYVVPWVESTLCDVLFLTYLFEQHVKHSNGKFNADKNGDFELQGTASAAKAAKWVAQDFYLADVMGFGANHR